MTTPAHAPTRDAVEAALHRLWIGEPKARLRLEDQKKSLELVAMLREISLSLSRLGKGSKTIVDAAAGKSYLGLLTAELLATQLSERDSIVTLEREAPKVEASRKAAAQMRSPCSVDCRIADVSEALAWPRSPTLVMALHACGGATDLILQQSIQAGAKTLLVVPCCTGKSVHRMAQAEALAASLALPKQANVRRRFLQSIVDAMRTYELEAAGYRTEVVEFVAPTVSPHNLLFRATLTHDQGLAERAALGLKRLLG